jgi:hypothetical protein
MRERDVGALARTNNIKVLQEDGLVQLLRALPAR